MSARALRGLCLQYLVASDSTHLDLALKQFETATNMTDRLGALSVVARYGDNESRQRLLDDFYQQWQHETLALNQWFQVQAGIPDAEAISRVERLLEHADFDLGNPNKLRSLIGVFSTANNVNFHRSDGAGYRLLADIVMEMDARNPQIAARLLAPLTKWRNYCEGQVQMKEQLARIAASPSLSPDVFEVVSKSLD